MKRITSIILLLATLLAALTLGLCSCNSKKDDDKDEKQEKEEVSTELTRAQWEAAFSEKQFENFTYKEVAVVKLLGVETVGETVYEFEKTKAKISATLMGQESSQTVSSSQIENVRTSFMDSLLPMVEYDDYTYDPETKTYKLTGSFVIPSLGAEATTATIKFEEGKVVEMTYTCLVEEPGFECDASSTITFSKYGTTKVSD